MRLISLLMLFLTVAGHSTSCKMRHTSTLSISGLLAFAEAFRI